MLSLSRSPFTELRVGLLKYTQKQNNNINNLQNKRHKTQNTARFKQKVNYNQVPLNSLIHTLILGQVKVSKCLNQVITRLAVV